MSGVAAGKTNVAVALDTLREMIFRGELAPGSNHLETELAARLGMSRTPVREAAMILQEQGLVTVQARRGIRILPISAQDMAEIYDLLTLLESEAAASAAGRVTDPRDLTPLSDAIDAMETALAREDRLAWADADDAFHTALVDLGGNARLAAIVGQMADQVRRARRVTLFLRPMPHQSNRDHRAVLEAIRAGDGETAAALHRAHRLASKRMLVALLEQNHLHLV